jgi:dihydropteroate synthase
MHIKPRVLNLKNKRGIEEELEKIGVSREGRRILSQKANLYLIKLEGVPSRAANLIKQEMLSVSADAAIKKEVASFTVSRSDVLLIGTEAHYNKVIPELRRQPFSLSHLSCELEQILKNIKRERFILSLGDKQLDLAKKVAIMGILNLTPDSFYDGGRYTQEKKALVRVEEMASHGADLIDVGGESTRPGATKVSTEEELRRIIPIIGKIKKLFEIPVSVDTYKAQIAQEAIEAGADMINDISGLRFDSEMKQVVAKYKVPLVLMHIKGTPRDMQSNPYYDSLLGEITSYLGESILIAKEAGIDEERIVIDPGIGFGKSVRHNLEIINKLSELKSLGRPILIGVSRKSFIGNILNLPLQERLEGSLAATCLAVTQGARIVRTHDVKETRRAIDLTQAILEA